MKLHHWLYLVYVTLIELQMLKFFTLFSFTNARTYKVKSSSILEVKTFSTIQLYSGSIQLYSGTIQAQ